MLASGDLRKVALDRIARLMEFARRHSIQRPELAHEAALLAMRIARKARVKMPLRYRRLVCRRCGTPFYIPGSFTVRIRSRRSTHIVIKCHVCGYVKRISVVKEKARKRKV